MTDGGQRIALHEHELDLTESTINPDIEAVYVAFFRVGQDN